MLVELEYLQIFLFLILREIFNLIRLFTELNDIKTQWDTVDLKIFLKVNFIQAFYKAHPKILHLFILGKNLRIYSHIFTLRFTKTKKYFLNSSLIPLFLNLLRIRILFLTNTFITNIPFYYSNDIISLKQVLSSIKQSYSMIVIPDFLYKNLYDKKGKYFQVEVEEDMVLKLDKSWRNFDDYLDALKTKYRKKINLMIRKTEKIDVRILNNENLENYSLIMQNMFDQVARESSFKGPMFNVETFRLLDHEIVKVYGYFMGEKIVAFSSEIQHNNTLYSYYTGFNKDLNKSIPIYGRILTEHIKNAIKFNVNGLVFGRTANEFKSNFGAKPIKSFVYIRVKNRILHLFLKPLFSRLSTKDWIMRNPF